MKHKNRNGKMNAAPAEAHLPNRYRAAPEFDEAGVIKGAPSFAPLIAAAVLVGALFAALGFFA